MSTILPQPDIELFGIRLQEPVTTITDVFLALICFYAYHKLTRSKKSGNPIYFLRYYFLFMAIATLAGGIIGHGFQYFFGLKWKLLGWLTSMFAVMLIERSAIEYTSNLISDKWHRFFLRFNIVELLTIMSLTAYSMNFKFVEFHAVYGFLVVVFTCHLYCYLKTKDPGSRYFLYGIAILVMAMFVFNYPVSLHRWFNHADLSHILMMWASLLFLKGAFLFEEPPVASDIKT